MFGRERGIKALIPDARSLIMTRDTGIGGQKMCFLRLLKMKSKDSLASKRVKDRELTKVDPQFVTPTVTMRTKFRAFIRNVPLIQRAQSAENR